MSGLQGIGKGALRVAKNYTKGYSDTQSKVRDATSNDPWGPSGTQMNEIAQLTYNQNDFVEIMEMLDKRLNDKGKNWRHVFKSLTLLDYCLHAGSENVVIYFRDNLYVVKTLREFQFVDEYEKDQGANVRQKAKDIVNLLQDESRLRQERRSRANMRDRMVSGRNNYDDDNATGVRDEDENARRRSRSVPAGRRRTDDQLQKAIEESMRTAADEQAKHRRTAEEKDLEQAIKLSQEEENKRNKAVEDSNAASLFDDANQLAPQPTNPFPQFDQGLQPQFTAMQPQFTAMQPQFTSFNPYQQQAQQEAMQVEYLRQQQEWMRQQQELQAQQLAQQQAAAQQEEWMRQQQMLQLQQQQQQPQQQMFLQAQPQQQLMAQPTGFGSNNPFAPSTGQQSISPQPSQSSSQFSNFNLPGTFSNTSAPTPPPAAPSPAQFQQQQQPARGPTRADEENQHLASLIGNREDGMDTFGNIGQLRYGHTGAAGRLGAQQTGAPGGNNPFARQQQQQSDQPFFSI